MWSGLRRRCRSAYSLRLICYSHRRPLAPTSGNTRRSILSSTSVVYPWFNTNVLSTVSSSYLVCSDAEAMRGGISNNDKTTIKKAITRASSSMDFPARSMLVGPHSTCLWCSPSRSTASPSNCSFPMRAEGDGVFTLIRYAGRTHRSALFGSGTITSMVRSAFRAQSGSSRSGNPSQVLGAGVPSFRHFPYRAQQVLQLYKQFLQLIYHYHRPEEQRDLLFRLRQEFASRRHLKGQKVIAVALRRGQGMLDYHRQLLDARETKQHLVRYQRNGRRMTHHLENKGGYMHAGGATAAATSVNDAWGRLRVLSGNILPGLALYDCSLPIQESSSGGGGAIGNSSSANSIYSRRQP